MQPRFGFVPSAELENLITKTIARLSNDSATDPLYPYRNQLIEKIAEELIENIVVKMADTGYQDERSEQIRKLGHFLEGAVTKIVRVMLSKDPDDVVMQSIPFLYDTVARDQAGRLRVGMAITPDFYQKVSRIVSQLQAGTANDAIKPDIVQAFIYYDDRILQHFLTDFVETLNWGVVKRNLAKGVKSTISKANHVLVKRIVPKVSLTEMQIIAPVITSMFFETDTPKAFQ